MNDAHLLIGSLVERTGRSVHTIRWYERQGAVSCLANRCHCDGPQWG